MRKFFLICGMILCVGDRFYILFDIVTWAIDLKNEWLRVHVACKLDIDSLLNELKKLESTFCRGDAT